MAISVNFWDNSGHTNIEVTFSQVMKILKLSHTKSDPDDLPVRN